MALWHLKSPKYADEPAMIGDLITYQGDYWALTGYDEPAEEIYIAKDKTLITVRAEEVNMGWGTQ